MIWFNLLGSLKEMESIETQHTYLPQVLQNPQELIHHSRFPTHELTYHLDELNPNSLPWQGMHVTVTL